MKHNKSAYRGIFFQNEDDKEAVEVKIFRSEYEYRADSEAREYCKEQGYARYELWDPAF